MILAKILIHPRSGQRDAILDLLQSIQGSAQGMAGCMECAVFEQYGEEQGILYLEQWLSIEDLSRHIQSDLYLRMLLALELADRPPEISFSDITNVRGMAWIEDLRLQTETPL